MAKRPSAEPVPTDEGEEADVELVEPDPVEDAVEVILEPESDEGIPGEGEDEEPLAEESMLPVPSPSSLRDLAPLDALSLYLRELSRYPTLSREEEHELAVQYRTNNDLSAAYKLVTSNLWLVVKIAREYERAARNLLDLVQEGNIGLMEAVKNFDPYRGVRLPSYATWWIRAYIVRYVIANWRMVKIGTTQAQRKLFFNLKKEKERLEREGFTPTPKLLADSLSVRESDVVEMEQRMASSDLSVDAPLQGDSDSSLHGVLPAPIPTAEDAVAERQLRAQLLRGLEEFSHTLKEKELIIFRERMLAEEKATLQDLAEKLSLSRERIRQIEARVKEKLRDYLLEHFGSTLEELNF